MTTIWALIKRYTSPKTDKYYGISGWAEVVRGTLIFYLFSCCILLFFLLEIINYFILEQTLLTLTLGLIAFLLMNRKLMVFRIFYTAFILVITLYIFIFLLDEIYFYDIFTIIVFSSIIIYNISTIIYLFISKRIKNTFRKLKAVKTDYEIVMNTKHSSIGILPYLVFEENSKDIPKDTNHLTNNIIQLNDWKKKQD